MKEKLEKALQEAGLDKGLAEFLNVTSEDKIEGVVAKLKPTPQKPNYDEVLASDEFKDYIETTGFDAVIEKNKALKSGVDKKVTTGVNTFKENMNKKKGDEGIEENEILKQMQKLADEIKDLKQKGTQSEKLTSAKAALEKSKLPKNLAEAWVGRIDLEKPLTEQVTALETEYQGISDKVLGENAGKGLPIGGTPKGEPSEEDVEAIIDGVV